MAQRSVWRGAISFGLIYVPIEMFSASREHALNLHFLDSRDFAPVGYERINKVTGKSVDWQHIVKGYEYEKGQYVALSDADFKSANVKASETIDISSFTNAADISPAYYHAPYYLLPSKGGEKVYALLSQALKATGRVAVATFVMRGRQHLCVVTPAADSLMLVTLRFADELIPAVKNSREGPKSAAPKPAELAMARKLVEEMSGAWKPQAFHDTYREDLMRRIRDKISKKQTHQLASEPKKTARSKAEVVNIMDALKKSLTLKGKQGMRRAAPKTAQERKRA
ncbi:MAG TPA: Ku protein [Steroidobacteraceae bacterium]